MEVWKTILLAIGGNAAFLAVIGWLGKSVLQSILARDISKFEAELKANAAMAIETLKSDLEIQATEHRVRFSDLHARRASVIAELYGKLVEALWAAESFLSPFEWAGETKKEEKHVAAMNALVDLYRFFDKNRIYLPAKICGSLDSLMQTVRSQVVQFGVYVERNYGSGSDEAERRKHEAWGRGWDTIKNKVPEARSSLEHELRALLGGQSSAAGEPFSPQPLPPVT